VGALSGRSEPHKYRRRVVESQKRIRRAITPVFSGNIDGPGDQSIDPMKRAFGVSGSRFDKSFFRNDNASKLVYYAELVRVYHSNQAMQDELERQA